MRLYMELFVLCAGLLQFPWVLRFTGIECRCSLVIVSHSCHPMVYPGHPVLLRLLACPKVPHAIFVSRQPALQPPERPVRTRPLTHQNGSLLWALHARLQATLCNNPYHSAPCYFLSFPLCPSPQGCSSWLLQ